MTFPRNGKLCVHAGCLILSARVVIARQGRDDVMNTPHDRHPGIVRMKSIVRAHTSCMSEVIKKVHALEGRINSSKTFQEHWEMKTSAVYIVENGPVAHRPETISTIATKAHL